MDHAVAETAAIASSMCCVVSGLCREAYRRDGGIGVEREPFSARCT
jgi:hypothetical protein